MKILIKEEFSHPIKRIYKTPLAVIMLNGEDWYEW